MDTEMILMAIILLLLFFMVLTIISSVIFVHTGKKKKYEKAFNDGVNSAKLNYKPVLKAEELQQIIYSTAKYHFDKRKALVYDLNNLRYYKIEDELSYLSHEVRDVFSESFARDFNFYYEKDYLDRYIVSIVEIFLINDLKMRRPK